MTAFDRTLIVQFRGHERNHPFYCFSGLNASLTPESSCYFARARPVAVDCARGTADCFLLRQDTYAASAGRIRTSFSFVSGARPLRARLPICGVSAAPLSVSSYALPPRPVPINTTPALPMASA